MYLAKTMPPRQPWRWIEPKKRNCESWINYDICQAMTQKTTLTGWIWPNPSPASVQVVCNQFPFASAASLAWDGLTMFCVFRNWQRKTRPDRQNGNEGERWRDGSGRGKSHLKWDDFLDTFQLPTPLRYAPGAKTRTTVFFDSTWVLCRSETSSWQLRVGIQLHSKW